MDIVTLGAALNGSAEYVNSHFVGGSNIQIVDNPDGTQTINASGEVSSEDTVARAEIAVIKDGTDIDSFGDVETALATKANASTTYTKTEVDTALSAKANSADVYTKTAVDTALGNKADKSTTYTKTEVDTALSAKADKSTTYTKTEVDTALDDKVDKETGKGLSTNDYTDTEKSKLAGIAEGAEVNVQSNWTQTTTTADDYIKNKPTLGTAAAKNATDTYNATGTDVTTGKAVAAALATLPEPMVFKGSLGTGGTITTLPTASSSNKGYVYKVITAGIYASQSAKVGDTFISDGSAWVLIPSGDEPSGTVTNVAVANGGGLTVSGSPITSSGTITVGHSNSVTAKTSSSLKKFTYDEHGHVTDSSELSTAESNALASGIDSTKVEQIETNKNNISTDEAALVELVDGGAKNIADFTSTTKTAFTTSTYGGVTVTRNGDIFTISGTNNISNNFFNIYYDGSTSTKMIPPGNWVALIEDYTGSVVKDIAVQPCIPTAFPKLYGTPVQFSLSGSESGNWLRVNLRPSTTYDGSFRLMICSQEDYAISSKFVPYRPSYEDTAKHISLLNQYGGGKNKLNYTIDIAKALNTSSIYSWSGNTCTVNGITFTFNADKTISASGTIADTTTNVILSLTSFTGTTGDILSAEQTENAYIYLKGGSTGTASARYAEWNSGDVGVARVVALLILATAGTVNIKFKPMVSTKTDYNASSTYQPYALSNAELTTAIQALQAQLANQ